MLPISATFRAVVAASFLTAGLACVTWTRPQAPATALQYVGGQTFQVTRSDRSVTTMKNALIVGDSLVGASVDGTNARISIPVRDIQGVASREIDPGRTLALTGGILLSALGVLALIAIIALSNAHYE